MASKSAVRFGVVGSGIGGLHVREILKYKPRNLRVTAVADIVREKADALAAQAGAKAFYDAYEMIDSGLIDVLLIATPHYLHPPLAIYAARKKLHVITEKPIAVTVGPARMMLEEARKNKVALGVVFNNRTRPVWRKMHEMIAAGAVGDIVRVQLITTNWYRTQAYYNSGAWRGTWQGEGGGILLNQAPHFLDVMLWMGGVPKKVLATVSTRTHKIEVENTAHAILDYGNGRTGSIVATTAETPGMNQLTVVGDKGTLVGNGDDTLRYAKVSPSLTKHITTATDAWSNPKVTWKDIAIPASDESGYVNINKAFAEHILSGKPMIASGADGLAQLELSNAIYLSGFRNQAVELPVDAAKMERLLDELIRTRGAGKGMDLRKEAKREMARVLKSS